MPPSRSVHMTLTRPKQLFAALAGDAPSTVKAEPGARPEPAFSCDGLQHDAGGIVTKAFELRGQLCQTGQNLRLDSEGGGKIVLEFDDGAARDWFEFRQAANGKALRILIELE